ncbi:MAG TPA: TatD family hydrolase [Actinomycetota bacterium]|nr:TatD family hydrolase [Actinomycetota bacterium]
MTATARAVWFDTHCHLHLCDTAPAGELVGRARDAGVADVVTVGIDVGSSRAAVDIAERHGVYAAAGMHPNSATAWDDAAAEAIASLLVRACVVAVGETGLDFYRDACPPDRQRAAFEDHVRLAQEHDKALVIHTRASVDDALEVLERVGPPARLVFHCWSGDRNALRRALALGAYVSFAGNLTFPSAADLRGVAAEVPPERLVVETDSPYLGPVPRRGRPNEPANVEHVGRALAAAVAMPTEEVAALTTRNARRLFGVAP